PNCRCLRSVRTAPMRRSLPGHPTGSEAGSSSGEGSPWAEQEVLAGSPVGRTSTITKPPEGFASRAVDLTPWSAGGPGPEHLACTDHSCNDVLPGDSRFERRGKVSETLIESAGLWP